MTLGPRVIGLGEMALRVVARPGAWFALLAAEPEITPVADRLAEEIAMLGDTEPKRADAGTGAAAIATAARDAEGRILVIASVEGIGDEEWRHLDLLRSQIVRDEPVVLVLSEGKVAIVGGEKDQSRLKDLPRFKRSDGAWFHFTLTVAERTKHQHVALVGYDFELVFPDGAQPAFVRFDLNPPDHHNEEEGLRSHMHPGTDDFSAPSPLMSPLEILDVLLYDLRIKREKARG